MQGSLQVTVPAGDNEPATTIDFTPPFRVCLLLNGGAGCGAATRILMPSLRVRLYRRARSQVMDLTTELEKCIGGPLPDLNREGRMVALAGATLPPPPSPPPLPAPADRPLERGFLRVTGTAV